MAGIYIHIPFCKQKCTYCDFHFSTTYAAYRDRMIAAINQEIVKRITYVKDEEIATIYFGGGTPSLLSFEEVEKILNTIRRNYQVSADVEVTLETNPDDINKKSASDWIKIGVNRLSIGIQSFREVDLKWMNRAHNVLEARQCVGIAKKAGFKNITIDLIYGLPSCSNEEWRTHVKEAIAMDVQHISAYCLTVEQKTALHKMVEKGEMIPASDDEQSEQFYLLINELEKAGLYQYEISNFAKPGYESNHNSSYWKSSSYIGVGPSAHSFNKLSRRWNVANNQQYMKFIESGDQYWEEEILSKKDIFNESLLTGLRTAYGVSLESLRSLFELDDDFKGKVSEFIELGWMLESESKIILTKEGRLKADYISAELFRD
jgi:oxygen-independent coproporphyrinogen-3 oxidase